MKLKDAKQQRATAEHQLATVRATVEAKALEKTLSLIESPQPVRVPWSEYPAYDDWGMTGAPSERPYLWTGPDDRSDGRYLPLYENELDCRRMRAQARSLVELFPVAKGALQKLSDYIIGNGFEFVVQPKKRYKKDPIAKQITAIVQHVMDDFLQSNEFIGNLDREIHEQSRIDGNVFPTLYAHKEHRHVRIELTDPGCILEPANKSQLERMLRLSHKLNYWWHGVHTLHCPGMKRDDVTHPLGYHAVFDRQGEQWDYLQSYRVEHIKRNVGQWARVGVSDFVTVLESLEHEAKIRKNTAVGAAILAAIVMIRQHAEGTSRSSIEGMVSDNATSSYEKPVQGGSRTTYSENVRPGTIKDAPAGMTQTLGAMGQLRSPVYIEVAKYLQSVVGQPWSMPYYLISGDASDANYASTLVSESPFIKYCEHQQSLYAGSCERLIWKAMRLYHEMGVFRGYDWHQIRQMLEINAGYTSPASRNKLEQAQSNLILVENGVMSKRTWANDSGLDYDEEQEELGGGGEGEGEGLETIQLNGLQVTAASEILQQVSAGETAELVAVGLLQSIGLPPSLAKQMVRAAAAKAGEVQAKKAQELANKPPSPFGGPPAQGPPRPPQANYESLDPRILREEELAIGAIDRLMEGANANP
jgi:capsid protein